MSAFFFYQTVNKKFTFLVELLLNCWLKSEINSDIIKNKIKGIVLFRCTFVFKAGD